MSQKPNCLDAFKDWQVEWDVFAQAYKVVPRASYTVVIMVKTDDIRYENSKQLSFDELPAEVKTMLVFEQAQEQLGEVFCDVIPPEGEPESG